MIYKVKEEWAVSFYSTNAPLEKLTSLFHLADNNEELMQYLREDGFEVSEVEPAVKLDFDDR